MDTLAFGCSLPTVRAAWGLTPVRIRSCWANQEQPEEAGAAFLLAQDMLAAKGRELLKAYRRTVQELADQRSTEMRLRAQLEAARTRIAALEERLKGGEDMQAKVFSPENIADYAKGLSSDEEASFVAGMMQQICIRSRYFEPSVFDTIDAIKTDRERARHEREGKLQGPAQAQVVIKAETGSTVRAYDIHHNDNVDSSKL